MSHILYALYSLSHLVVQVTQSLKHVDGCGLVCFSDLLNQLVTAENCNTTEDGSESAEQNAAPGSPTSARRGSHSADCHEIQPKYTTEQLEAVRK